MLVVEVDRLDAKTPERGLARAAHVLRRAVDAQELAVLSAQVTELGGQEDPRAPRSDRLSDQHLVLERPVHVSGVEEVHSPVERLVDEGNAL